MNAAHPDHAHLDAETLAAWIDGGLDAAALAAAEAHVSNCDRCQALVATTMKTLPAEAATVPAGIRLWRWWLAPIAAATAAVLIWAVVPQRSNEPMLMRSIETSPQTVSPPAASGARENVQQPSPVPEPAPAPKRQQRFADESSRPAQTDTLAANREARADAVAPAAPLPAAVPPFAPVPAPVAAAPPAAAPTIAAAPRAATAETAMAREEKAADRAMAGAPAPAEMQKRMGQAAAIEIASPDPARRWRVAADHSVERTEDGGRTWLQIRAAQGNTITAGSAPSATVCWIVGANGLVLLTTDGSRFTRIAFPAPADLTAVTAADARRATVTAADGRSFSTTDGGATWRQ